MSVWVCSCVRVRQWSGKAAKTYGRRLWRAIFFVFFSFCDRRYWVRRGVNERLAGVQQRAEHVVRDEAGVDRE